MNKYPYTTRAIALIVGLGLMIGMLVITPIIIERGLIVPLMVAFVGFLILISLKMDRDEAKEDKKRNKKAVQHGSSYLFSGRWGTPPFQRTLYHV